MLSHANHCEFCQHQQRDFKQGSTCGLTQKKPFFNSSCSSILFKSDFPDYIIRTHTIFRRISRTKLFTIIYFVVFVAMGSGAIYLGYYMNQYLILNKVLSIVPFLIMGIGLLLIGIGFGAYNRFRRDFDWISNKKGILDLLLPKYGTNPNINLDYGAKFHGKQEVSAKFNLNGRPINTKVEVDLLQPLRKKLNR